MDWVQRMKTKKILRTSIFRLGDNEIYSVIQQNAEF